MKIAYTFDTADYAEVFEVMGDTNTKVARITVYDETEGESATVEVSPKDLRAMSVALSTVANRLDPSEPSPVIQLGRTFQAGYPTGTTGF